MSDAALMMQYDANKKSTGTAYLLWFFLSMFGAHRFYLGASGTGAAILIITLLSFPLMIVAVGFFTI
jgi:TM2 domain-containing membrane protein YozV